MKKKNTHTNQPQIDIIILRRNFDETLKSLIETGYYTFNANTSKRLTFEILLIHCSDREIVSTTSPNALFKPVDSEENMVRPKKNSLKVVFLG